MEKRTVATKTDVGNGSAIGLALAPFALLSCLWIPTLALTSGAAMIVAGVFDLRGASARRRRIALLTVSLGLAALALCAIVVIVSSGSSSGTAGSSVPPPA